MPLLKRRAVAWIVTGLVVLLSILLGFSSSLGALRAEAERAFAEGVSEEEPGIQYDLEWLLDLSHNLTVVAKRYLAANDPAVTGVEDARAKLTAAQSPADKYDAAERLVVAGSALHHALRQQALSERDAQYNESAMADIESRWLILGRNPYNERAAAFNSELERFPANVLSRLVFIEPLERFAP